MIRKALANGHEEHPEAQASVVPYEWSKGENIQRFPKGNGLYNGDIYFFNYIELYIYIHINHLKTLKDGDLE